MIRNQLIAAAVAIALSPVAFAGNTSTIVGGADAGSLPSVTVHSNSRFGDYTGVAGSMVNADGPQYNFSQVREYTGVIGDSNPALVARVPAWNLAMAHDYTGE